MRCGLSILVAASAVLALAPAAEAHAMLDRASPAVGATVQGSPDEIRLQFSEGVEAAVSRITLTDATGAALPLERPATDPSRRQILAAHLKASLPPGDYHVAWRVVSVDGHVTEGDFSFTVRP